MGTSTDSDQIIPFWGPVTSSIDFCEDNYVYTRYCAELWNAVSSLFIVWVGVLAFCTVLSLKKGDYYRLWVESAAPLQGGAHGKAKLAGVVPGVLSPAAYTPKTSLCGVLHTLVTIGRTPNTQTLPPEICFQLLIFPRFVGCWLFFLLVGGGSFLFHGTMRRSFQALDELPMVVGNVIFLLCLKCTRKSCLQEADWRQWVKNYFKTGQARRLSQMDAHPNSSSSRGRRSGSSATGGNGGGTSSIRDNGDLVERSCLLERQLWKSHYKCACVFLLLLGMLKVSLYVVFENYACFFLSYGLGVVVLVGWSLHNLLVLDMGMEENKQIYSRLLKHAFLCYGTGFGLWMCENLFCGWLKVFHLHIFWHFFAGWGTMLFVISLIVNHLDSLGVECRLGYRRIIFPRLSFEF